MTSALECACDWPGVPRIRVGGGGDLLDVEAYAMVSFAHISDESIHFC